MVNQIVTMQINQDRTIRGWINRFGIQQPPHFDQVGVWQESRTEGTEGRRQNDGLREITTRN